MPCAAGPGGAGQGADAQRAATFGRGKQEKEVARLAGIEPTTLGFGGQYSIH